MQSQKTSGFKVGTKENSLFTHVRGHKHFDTLASQKRPTSYIFMSVCRFTLDPP